MSGLAAVTSGVGSEAVSRSGQLGKPVAVAAVGGLPPSLFEQYIQYLNFVSARRQMGNERLGDRVVDCLDFYAGTGVYSSRCDNICDGLEYLIEKICDFIQGIFGYSKWQTTCAVCEDQCIVSAAFADAFLPILMDIREKKVPASSQPEFDKTATFLERVVRDLDNLRLAIEKDLRKYLKNRLVADDQTNERRISSIMGHLGELQKAMPEAIYPGMSEIVGLTEKNRNPLIRVVIEEMKKVIHEEVIPALRSLKEYCPNDLLSKLKELEEGCVFIDKSFGEMLIEIESQRVSTG